MSAPCEIEESPESIIEKLGNFHLVDYKENIPVCKGCFNEHGPCGTPCQGCERREAWNKEFETYLMILDQFVIYKRKASVGGKGT